MSDIQRYKILDQMSDFFGVEMVKYDDHLSVVEEQKNDLQYYMDMYKKDQARIDELEQLLQRVQAGYFGKPISQIKADGIRDFKESFMQGLLSRQIDADDFDEYADKLEK